MFRRRWSGLPDDPSFPTSLEGLGYFVNENDEIRSIKQPEAYFKYFLDKNPRINDRQRFNFHAEVERIVHERLEKQGLAKLLLPTTVSDPSEPHVPIFVSQDVEQKPRVVLILGESAQDLGILAWRVVNGPGGIDQGSMVSVLRYLGKQPCSRDDPTPPGTILANTGQLYWWPEGRRALTRLGRIGAPRQSMAHTDRWCDPKVNGIPQNATVEDHVCYIFNHFVARSLRQKTKLHIIALGDSVHEITQFLDQNWTTWAGCVQALALVGGYASVDGYTSASFKTFLRERGRAYICAEESLGDAISGPDGNRESIYMTDYGCPVFSSGHRYFDEMAFVKSHTAVLDWMQEVALDATYQNPAIVPVLRNEDAGEDTDKDSAVAREAALNEEAWAKLSQQQMPSVIFYDNEALQAEADELKRMEQLLETGPA